MRYISSFPFQTKIIHDWIPLSDGTKLWYKAWLPITSQPVPAILEYLPYRAGDWTAPRDHERHPFYAGYGYASIRVDIRGHGNSEGVPGDEYDAQELADGVEVIHWIAEQPWCTGKVGMFGISWGGFNSLQLAALQPPPLKAIVTTCSTDDRYDNDVHYFGGSLLGVDMHAWAATMLAFESRPPDIAVWGDAWLDQWIYRLNRMEPFIDTWLSHQTRDSYWQHGSVCEDYSALNAAVLAVGGWCDPYRDTVLRLCHHLSALDKPVRGIIGPWAHQYPDRDLRPGPHIDFLKETLRWWDYWLKNEDNGALDTPLLRTWITDSLPPAPAYDCLPGRWVATALWPSDSISTSLWELSTAHLSPLSSRSSEGIRIRTPQHCGSCAGRYFPFGNDADLPIDQRYDDGLSTLFDFPLDTDLEILGNCRLHLNVCSETTRGQIYVRLCDVAPDGSSTLITRGNLNFSSREGRDKAIPMPPHQWVNVEVPLTGIGYRIPAGHVLRVALSTAYWPWIWPQPECGDLLIDPHTSAVEMSLRNVPAAAELPAPEFDSPVQAEPLAVSYPESTGAGSQRPERLISHDIAAQETFIQVDPAYGGTRIYPDGLHFEEDSVERYWIRWDDPLSARTQSQWSIRLSRPDHGWLARLTADTEIRCDAENFYTLSRVHCWAGDEEVFHKTWERTIPRQVS
ncbi:CocE/NonD family hydrolase [Corynebacterium sp. 3HC-13]|uniref:CocE/NonD family hydrolase n=1 Tax=Corynebacterium poyangense TaxID=2684405 RepID=UPI001CCD3955|nr:CocE/NonD family hydrolase [Corynebacterium poyangense]MBZ8176777.1 CocE/NonD family hydrolase [Corynebacterium poyangense]